MPGPLNQGEGIASTYWGKLSTRLAFSSFLLWLQQMQKQEAIVYKASEA